MNKTNLQLFLFSISQICAYSAFASSAISPNLGRLFYTPEQRQELHQTKRKGLRTNIQLNGIVKPSDGHATVWINGVPYYAQSPVVLKDSTSVRVPVNQQYITLKVGEAIETEE